MEIRLTVYCDKDFPRVYHFHTDMKQTSYLFLSNVCWMIIVWDYYPRKSCKVVYLLTRSIFGLLICMEIWNKPVTCFDHHVRHVAEMSCRVRIGLSWFEFISCLNYCHLELFPQKFVEVQHCHESFFEIRNWALNVSYFRNWENNTVAFYVQDYFMCDSIAAWLTWCWNKHGEWFLNQQYDFYNDVEKSNRCPM